MPKQLPLLIISALLFLHGCAKRKPAPSETNETASAANVQPTISSPHYAAELFCYVGEIGSRTNAHIIISDPNKETNPNLKINSQSISCGYPGKVSKISWKFIQHKENKDIYSFERTFPVYANEQSTTFQVVEYEGKQTIVFQDEYHVVVLDIPK